MWVEEEIRWHCYGVSATQQHVAVSCRSDESRHRVAVNGPTRTQGPIRTWSDVREKSKTESRFDLFFLIWQQVGVFLQLLKTRFKNSNKMKQITKEVFFS